TDLYITIPACSSVHLDAGIYYYDPYHHALLKVRAGDWSDTIVRCCGLEFESTPEFIIGLGSNFGRTAYYYEDFAYRLVTQEIGLLESNVVLAGKCNGFSPYVCHFFQDDAINEIYEVTGIEESMMSILLFFTNNVPD